MQQRRVWLVKQLLLTTTAATGAADMAAAEGTEDKEYRKNTSIHRASNQGRDKGLTARRSDGRRRVGDDRRSRRKKWRLLVSWMLVCVKWGEGEETVSQVIPPKRKWDSRLGRPILTNVINANGVRV